jgi:hypothetical protein
VLQLYHKSAVRTLGNNTRFVADLTGVVSLESWSYRTDVVVDFEKGCVYSQGSSEQNRRHQGEGAGAYRNQPIPILEISASKLMYFIRDYDGPKPYRPSANPEVLILGQDPTVDQCRRFSVALGFEKTPGSVDSESRNLQRYIRDRILASLRIDERRLIATNLINAYYSDVPNKKIAKTYQDLIVTLAKRKGIDVNQYPDRANGAILHAINFECGYRADFERVLSIPSIRHLITLGEPVFQVLRERYRLTHLAPKIRLVLTQAKENPPLVIVAGREVSLLPLPHIFNENNRRWKFYSDFLTKDCLDSQFLTKFEWVGRS